MKNIKYYKTMNDLLASTIDINKEYLLLVAENTNFSIETLNNQNIQFIGAIVTQVIYNEENYSSGLLCIELDVNSKSILIENIKDLNIKKEYFKDMNSITLILDGLSSHITPFLETIFNSVPQNAELIGGGAGKLTLKQEPVIFSKKGIFQDAALIIATSSNLTIGIENGWEFLEGPFLVSSSEKNILKSLNFENSFELYKRIVETDSGKMFNDDNFFDLAKSYPFGIIKFNKEIVVRDPISKDKDDNLILVGDVEQNSTINILKGNKNSLISSSGKAIKNVLEKKNENEISSVMLFDCISRSIFLENDFSLELKEIKKHIPTKTLFGALTLGEIANNGDEYINFYNKTCVVGALC